MADLIRSKMPISLAPEQPDAALIARDSPPEGPPTGPWIEAPDAPESPGASNPASATAGSARQGPVAVYPSEVLAAGGTPKLDELE